MTEADFDKIADLLHGTLDTRLAPLATKEDLRTLKEELKQYTHEGIETIMAELTRMEDILVEKEQVDKLKLWASKVGSKVGVSFKI